mmetsp:Transcript_2682/g.7943  ORF Transcript_2682/g.7943 Transcript_2682/m.7943 type:complete len:297 (-) Transcript_2682:17-907(-)
MNAACNGRAACFELFGFDVLLDKALKPWLIEVNVACSLASSSPLDKWIKNMLMTDLFHLIGLVPFHKKALADDAEEKRRSRLLRAATEPLKRRNVFELQETPIAALDNADLGVIMQAEDELRRCGHWCRVLPCDGMGDRYLPLFEFPRYRNTILAKWMASQDWALLEPHLDVSIAERLGVSTSPRQAAASACRTTTRSSELETALATRQSLVARRPLLKANTAPEFAFACVGRTNAAAPRNGTPSTRAPGARGLQVEPQGGGGECIPIRRERDEARGGAARTSPGSRGETHVLTSF